MDYGSQCIVDPRSSARLLWGMSQENKVRKKPVSHDDAEKKALGMNLAKARNEAGFTMDAAAKAIGLSDKRAIDNFEKGRNVIDALRLKHLARAYETTTDALVGSASAARNWPFSDELQQKVLSLKDEQVFRLENVMRAHLGLIPQSASSLPSGSAEGQQSDYSGRLEVGTGALNNAEIPAPQRNAPRTQDRRPKRRQGGRGA